jgi:hypothetical protein
VCRQIPFAFLLVILFTFAFLLFTFYHFYHIIGAYYGAHAAARALAAGETDRLDAFYVEIGRYLYEVIRAIDHAEIAALAPLFSYLYLSHGNLQISV